MDVRPAAFESRSLLRLQETKGSTGDNGFAFAVLLRGSCAESFSRGTVEVIDGTFRW